MSAVCPRPLPLRSCRRCGWVLCADSWLSCVREQQTPHPAPQSCFADALPHLHLAQSEAVRHVLGLLWQPGAVWQLGCRRRACRAATIGVASVPVQCESEEDAEACGVIWGRA